MIKMLETVGFDPMDNPEMAANVYAMRGEIEAAVEQFLELLSTQSVAANLNWRQTATLPQFIDVMNDPRVLEAIQRWEVEEERLREDVVRFLEDLQSA